jgi:hypothetical protein
MKLTFFLIETKHRFRGFSYIKVFILFLIKQIFFSIIRKFASLKVYNFTNGTSCTLQAKT